MASGGYRKPANPAPVSGPGANSRRTDGGPADRGTANLAASGGGYGERQAIEGQAASAPVPVGGGGAPSAGSAQGAPQGILGPTNRPSEPITAGALTPSTQETTDAQMLLRVLASKYNSPWILGLLND